MNIVSKSKTEFKDFELMGELEYSDTNYAEEQSQGFIPLSQTNLPASFYGGTVTALAKTKTNGVYLVMSGTKPLDILIDKSVIREPVKKKAE